MKARAAAVRVPVRIEVWAYCRYSSDRQSDASIEQQLTEIGRLCDKLGLPHPTKLRIYADRAKSGKSIKGRLELQRLVREAENDTRGQHVQRVLVLWDVDRLGRNFFDSVGIAGKLYQEHGFRILACDGLDSEDERFKSDLARAAESADRFLVRLRRNVTRGMEHARKKGHALGPCPYGFKRVAKVNVPDPPVMRWVTFMFETALATGANAAEVMRRLRAAPTGRKWPHKETVIRMLRNEKYVDAGAVTREMFDAVQVALAKRRDHFRRDLGGHFRDGTGTGRSPLLDLFTCAVCGGSVSTVMRDKIDRRLGCRRHMTDLDCPSQATVREGVLLQAVIEAIRARILDQDSIDQLTVDVQRKVEAATAANGATVGALDTQIADLQKRIRRLVLRAEQSDGPMPELADRLAELRAELTTLQERRDAAAAPTVAPVTVLRSAVQSYLPRLTAMLSAKGPELATVLRDLVRDGKLYSEGRGRPRVEFKLAPLGALISLFPSSARKGSLSCREYESVQQSVILRFSRGEVAA